MARLSRLCALVFGAVALTGCVTPTYGPLGPKNPFGYSDMRNADGSYTIRTVTLTPAQAHEYWDRRATELCGGPNFRKNIFSANIPIVATTGAVTNPMTGYTGVYTQDAYGALVMQGYLNCEAQTAAAAPEAAPATEGTATAIPASTAQSPSAPAN